MATFERADDHSESLTTGEGNSQKLLRLARQLDSKLSTAIQQTLAIVPIHNTLLQGFSELKLVAVGSTQDGSKVNTPFDAGDVDILLIATKKLLSEPLFRYVKDHPASLWLPGKNEENYFEDLTLIEGQFVPVSALRHIKKEYEKTLQVDINRKVQHGAYISEDRINTIERSKVGYKYESRPTEGMEDKSVEFDKCLSADIVPAFSFKGWPFTAKEWINRKREWPPEDVVKKVFETDCQIVAKQPLDTGTDLARIPDFIERDTVAKKEVDNNSDKQKVTTSYERTIDESTGENSAHKAEGNSDKEHGKDGYFRLSFSQCELVLAKNLSELQVLCWRILKAYQKAYFETQPQVLTSYHWKTVVFWVVEETPPTFWQEENIIEAVLKMLDKMIECLQKRFLPLYFVHKQNLITATSEYAIKQALEQVYHIRERPIESLQWFLDNPPKPDNLEVKEQSASADLKPRTLLDFMDENFNDSNSDLFSSPEKDVMELLKETLSRANNLGPIHTEANPQVKKSAENTPKSQTSTTETQGESMEINVKKEFEKRLGELTGFTKQEDIMNTCQGHVGVPDSAIPNLESVLQLAGKSLKILSKDERSGDESSEADPEFGRTLVGLMNQNPNNQASASSDTPSPFDFGNLMANMEKMMKEILNLPPTDKKTNKTSEGSDSETALAGKSLMSGVERSEADPEFGRTLVGLMKPNPNNQASASSETPSPFDFGNLMANMENCMKDSLVEQVKNDSNSRVSDSEMKQTATGEQREVEQTLYTRTDTPTGKEFEKPERYASKTNDLPPPDKKKVETSECAAPIV